MRRWVNATAWIAGDAARIREALAGDPAAWLPDCTPPPIGGGGTASDGGCDVLLRVGTMSHPLHVLVGPAKPAGASLWRGLTWAPVLHADPHHDHREAGSGPGPAPTGRGAALPPPRLDAQLGTVPVFPTACPGGWTGGESGLWLLLAGSYVPPLGVLGLPGDQAELDALADACATAMLSQVADRLRGVADPVAGVPATESAVVGDQPSVRGCRA